RDLHSFPTRRSSDLGKLDGMSVRVPTLNVSLVDLSFTTKKPTSVDAINKALIAGAKQFPKGVMECSNQPLVSCDYNGYPVSCVRSEEHTSELQSREN